MANTKDGAAKARAAKFGVTIDDLVIRELTEKHCMICRRWLPHDGFGVDKTRYDGRASACAGCRKTKHKERYVSRSSGLPMGPQAKPPRDNDKKQARQRVNALVRAGRLARPDSLPCFDCGHIWADGERRHEYDHYLGYAAEHHYAVQAVCVKCHSARDNLKARQTHCLRGHEFTIENTYRSTSGTRQCRACMSLHEKSRGPRGSEYWKAVNAKRRGKSTNG